MYFFKAELYKQIKKAKITLLVYTILFITYCEPSFAATISSRVYHSKYGPGTVRSRQGNGLLAVEFDNYGRLEFKQDSLRRTVSSSHGIVPRSRIYYGRYGAGTVKEVFDGVLSISFDDYQGRINIDSCKAKRTVNSSHRISVGNRIYHSKYTIGTVREAFDGVLSVDFDNYSGRIKISSDRARRPLYSSHHIYAGNRIYHNRYGTGTVREVFDGVLSVEFDDYNGRVNIPSENACRPLNSSHNISVGNRIYHQNYSTGLVREVFDGVLSVDFDNYNGRINISSENALRPLNSSHEISVGNRIRNQNYGLGTVREVFDGILSVSFDSYRGRVNISSSNATLHTHTRENISSTRAPDSIIPHKKNLDIHSLPKNLKKYIELFGECPTQLLEVNDKIRNLAIGHQKKSNKTVFNWFKRSKKCGECPICMTEDSDETVTISCGHAFHLDCINNGINAYLNSEDLEKLFACPKENCEEHIDAYELGKIVPDKETIIRIQLLLLRSLPGLQLCPICNDNFLSYKPRKGDQNFALCIHCLNETCLDCGESAHPGMTCEELKSDAGSELQFIRCLIQSGLDKNYGRCPSCGILIEKKDGCNQMTCGDNASDKNQLPSHLRKGRGCGIKFLWNDRIKLKDWLESRSS